MLIKEPASIPSHWQLHPWSFSHSILLLIMLLTNKFQIVGRKDGETAKNFGWQTLLLSSGDQGDRSGQKFRHYSRVLRRQGFVRLGDERRKRWQLQSKKTGNCSDRINTLVIADFGTVAVDIVCFCLKCLFWGGCFKVSSRKGELW